MVNTGQYDYGLLEQSQEDALHANRLLNVEERPFQRVSKNLTGKDSVLKALPKQLPSPPPEGQDGQVDLADEAFRRQRFREDILLDFAALESSIIRIQLIQSSNQRERERYAAEKAKILEAAQAVKENTVELRAQLVEAQKVLELRKGYDKLASRILDDKHVKSRDDSRAEIETLEKEIEDLQQESADYELTWTARREHFDRVVAEGALLIKHIRGVKDDTEGEKEDTEAEGANDHDDTKGESSQIGTPMPGGRTPAHLGGGDTPMPEGALDDTGNRTPRPVNRLLDIDDVDRPASNVSTPLHIQSDVDMAETSQTADEPETMTVDTAVAGVSEAADTMDET